MAKAQTITTPTFNNPTPEQIAAGLRAGRRARSQAMQDLGAQLGATLKGLVRRATDHAQAPARAATKLPSGGAV